MMPSLRPSALSHRGGPGDIDVRRTVGVERLAEEEPTAERAVLAPIGQHLDP
jgi:hypothetical protein